MYLNCFLKHGKARLEGKGVEPKVDDEAVLIKMDRKKVIFFFSRKNKQDLVTLGV